MKKTRWENFLEKNEKKIKISLIIIGILFILSGSLLAVMFTRISTYAASFAEDGICNLCDKLQFPIMGLFIFLGILLILSAFDIKKIGFMHVGLIAIIVGSFFYTNLYLFNRSVWFFLSIKYTLMLVGFYLIYKNKTWPTISSFKLTYNKAIYLSFLIFFVSLLLNSSKAKIIEMSARVLGTLLFMLFFITCSLLIGQFISEKLRFKLEKKDYITHFGFGLVSLATITALLGAVHLLYKQILIAIILIIPLLNYKKLADLFKKNKSTLLFKQRRYIDLAFIFIILVFIFSSFINVNDKSVAYDTGNYHFDVPKYFLKHHYLKYQPHKLHASTPMNMSFAYSYGLAFNSIVFSKSIAFCVHIFLLLLIYKISRKVMNISFSLIAVLLYLSSGVVANYFSKAYTDLSLAFFTLLSLWALVNFLKKRNAAHLYLAAIFIGFSVGIKINSVITLFLFGLFLIFGLFSKRISLKSLAIIIGIILLFGSFWYVRDIYYTGRVFHSNILIKNYVGHSFITYDNKAIIPLPFEHTAKYPHLKFYINYPKDLYGPDYKINNSKNNETAIGNSNNQNLKQSKKRYHSFFIQQSAEFLSVPKRLFQGTYFDTKTYKYDTIFGLIWVFPLALFFSRKNKIILLLALFALFYLLLGFWLGVFAQRYFSPVFTAMAICSSFLYYKIHSKLPKKYMKHLMLIVLALLIFIAIITPSAWMAKKINLDKTLPYNKNGILVYANEKLEETHKILILNNPTYLAYLDIEHQSGDMGLGNGGLDYFNIDSPEELYLQLVSNNYTHILFHQVEDRHFCYGVCGDGWRRFLYKTIKQYEVVFENKSRIIYKDNHNNTLYELIR